MTSTIVLLCFLAGMVAAQEVGEPKPDEPREDCYIKGSASLYQGKTNETSQHETCLSWQGFEIHPDERFPDGSRRKAGNYCREPTRKRDMPWCYVKEDQWEYCGVPECTKNF